jgi:hypothetical protein
MKLEEARFSSIPKFIRGGNYSIDMPLSMMEHWLSSQGALDLDPDFQRGHVWTDAQASKFVEFLLRGGQSSTHIYWNHPSYMGFKEPQSDLPEILMIVDGKQRLTACLRFMRDEIPVFGRHLSEFTNESDRRSALGMTGARLKMNINNLQTRQELLQWYLDLNDGGVVHSAEEIERVRALLAEAKANKEAA